MDDMINFIQECFPTIFGDEQKAILDHLILLGVECLDDFQHLDPEKDLKNTLNIIQARKLKKKIEDKFNNQGRIFNQSEVLDLIQSSSFAEEISEVELIQNPVIESIPKSVVASVPKPNFNFDTLLENILKRFPKALVRKLERGDRPSPPERREAVRIIVAEVMEQIPTPRKKHLEVVAMAVVQKYPESFKDAIGNDSIGFGHSSLLCQLISRAENSKRTPGTVKMAVSADIIKTTNKQFSDSYGCVNHQPSDYPDGENEITQQAKKIFLKIEFTKGLRDTEQVDQYMVDTYISQRITCNSKSSIKFITSEWPFLTEMKYLLQHATNLMGFSLREKLELALKEKFPELLNYVKSIDKNKEMDFLRPHLHLLHILCKIFNEDVECLLKMYESDKTISDIAEEAPVTPFIVCTGDPFQLAPVCTLIVENVPFQHHIPLDDCLLMWFSSFYVFNLKYPTEACATIEFMQRAIFGINPYSKGTKMEKRFGRRVNIHPKVLKLQNKLRDFTSKWNAYM